MALLSGMDGFKESVTRRSSHQIQVEESMSAVGLKIG